MSDYSMSIDLTYESPETSRLHKLEATVFIEQKMHPSGIIYSTTELTSVSLVRTNPFIHSRKIKVNPDSPLYQAINYAIEDALFP